MKNLLTTILLIITTWSLAQVGINTEDPSQMLDVEGRIEISDDNSPPTDGSIRYNASEEDFEGYADTQWQSFTRGSIGYPSNAIPVYGYHIAVTPNSQDDVFLFNHNVPANYIGTQVPSDKYLLVTHILIETNNLSLNYDNVSQVTVGGRTDGQSYSDIPRNLRFFVKWSNQQLFSGNFFPLLIVRPGEFLTVRNGINSQNTINVKVKGFLVDDLDFN